MISKIIFTILLYHIIGNESIFCAHSSVVFADVETSKKIPTIEFDGWYLYFSFGHLDKYSDKMLL